MFNYFQSSSLATKLTMINISSILVILGVFISVMVWLGLSLSKQINDDTHALVNSDLDHIMEGVYNLIDLKNEVITQQVKNNLKVAHYVVKQQGGLSISENSGDTVQWEAINQFTKEKNNIQLSKMLIGKRTWLGQNNSFTETTPIIDTVEAMVGGTITIFQRMNQQGDMLRVATNVKKKDGKRAIGTYIPATTPDAIGQQFSIVNKGGTPNAVVATLLRGETYRGIAFVVNDWYFTTYEPIFNENKQVVGALYVGVKQDNFTTLKQALMNIRVAKTGHVFVLEAKGDDRGRYIVSKDGEQDQVNILSLKDADGKYFVQNMINKATALKTNQFETVRYSLEENGKPRETMVRVAYYEPWNWVVGISLYTDEMVDYEHLQRLRLGKVLGTLTLIGLLMSFVVGGMTIVIAHNITAPINQFIRYLQNITGCSLSNHRSELKLFIQATQALDDYLQLKIKQINRLREGDIYTNMSKSAEQDDLGQALAALTIQMRQWVDITQTHVTDLEQLIYPVVQNEHASVYEANQHHIKHIIKSLDQIAQETEGLALNTTLDASQHLVSEQAIKLETQDSRQQLQHTLINVNQCIGDISQASQAIHTAVERLQTMTNNSNYSQQWVTQSAYASSQQLAQSVSNITSKLKQSMTQFFQA